MSERWLIRGETPGGDEDGDDGGNGNGSGGMGGEGDAPA
jgi:hypothetical protein